MNCAFSEHTHTCVCWYRQYFAALLLKGKETGVKLPPSIHARSLLEDHDHAGGMLRFVLELISEDKS